MAVIGKVSIKVYPDTDGFRGQTRRQLEKEMKGFKEKVEVSPEVDHKDLRDSLRLAVLRVRGDILTSPNKYKLTVPVEVDYQFDDEGFRNKLEKMQRDLGDERIKRTIHVDTDVDEDRAKQLSRDLLDGMQRDMDEREPLSPKLAPELDKDALRKALDDLDDEYKKNYEKGQRAARDVRAGRRQGVDLDQYKETAGWADGYLDRINDRQKWATVEDGLVDNMRRAAAKAGREARIPLEVDIDPRALRLAARDMAQEMRDRLGEASPVGNALRQLEDRIDMLAKRQREYKRAVDSGSNNAVDRARDIEKANRNLAASYNNVIEQIRKQEQVAKDAAQAELKTREKVIDQVAEKSRKTHEDELKRVEKERLVREREAERRRILDEKEAARQQKLLDDLMKSKQKAMEDNWRWAEKERAKQFDKETRDVLSNARTQAATSRRLLSQESTMRDQEARKAEREAKSALLREERELEAHLRRTEKARAKSDAAHLKRVEQQMERQGRLTRRLGGGSLDVLRRMSGMRLAGNLARDTWEPLSNFDIHLPKMLTMAAVTNQAAAAVGALSGNLLTLGRDAGRILPGALVLPGVFASMAVGALSLAFGLKDIAEQLPRVAEGFQRIPQAASDSFWASAKGAGTGLEGDLLNLGSAFEEGFKVSSAAAGSWFAQWADDIDKGLTPYIGGMFQGVADSFKALEAGGEGFATILKELGELGSRFAPDMAKWLADGLDTFGDWLSRKNASGELDEMVTTAWERTKDLGNVVKETYGFLDRLSAAAERAGGASLSNLADGMKRLNDAMDRPEVVLTVERLFSAAYKTSEAFTDAIKGGLGDFFYMVGSIAEDFGPKIGGTAGGLLGGLLEGLASPAMATSLSNFATEFQKLGDVISPVLVQSGEVAGILDTINAAIVPFGELGAVAVGGVLDLIDDLGPHLASAVEDLGNGAVDLAKSVFGPLTEAAKGLGPHIEDWGRIIGDFASDIAPTIETALGGLEPALDNIASGITKILDPLADGLAVVLKDIGPEVADLFETLGDLALKIGTNLGEGLEGFNWKGLGENLGKLISMIDQTLIKIEEVAGRINEGVKGEQLAALEWAEGAPFRDESLLNNAPLEVRAKLVLEMMDGNVDFWGNLTDQGRKELAGLRGDWDVTKAAIEQNPILADQEGFRILKELGEQGVDIEMRETGIKEAEDKIRAVETALSDVQALSAKGMQGTMSGLIEGINTAIPALHQAWDTMGIGEVKAQEMSTKLSSAMGQVQEAIGLTGISMGDFADKSSAAWETARQQGGEKLEALESAYSTLRTAMDETGITAEGLTQMLAMPGLSASAKGEIAALLEIVQGTEGQFGSATTAAENFAGSIDSIPGYKAIEVETKIKPLAYDDIMANIYAGKSPTAGLLAGDIQVSVKPTVDPAAQQAMLSGIKATPADVPVFPTVDPMATQTLVGSLSGIVVPPINVPIQVGEPGAPLPLQAFNDHVNTVRGNVSQGIGTSAIEQSLQNISSFGPSAATGLDATGTAASNASGKTDALATSLPKIDTALKTTYDTAGVFAKQVETHATTASTSMEKAAGGIEASGIRGNKAFQILGDEAGKMAGKVDSGGKKAVGSAKSAAGGIEGAFSGVSLSSEGAAIMQSLINGINSKKGALRGTLRDVTAMIPANKGPIEKDRKLLEPAGKAIMDGLMAGIMDGAGNVLVPGLQSLTRDIGKGIDPSVILQAHGWADAMRGQIGSAQQAGNELGSAIGDGVNEGMAGLFDDMMADLNKELAPIFETEKVAGRNIEIAKASSAVSSIPMQTASKGTTVNITQNYPKQDDSADAVAKAAHLATLYI